MVTIDGVRYEPTSGGLQRRFDDSARRLTVDLADTEPVTIKDLIERCSNSYGWVSIRNQKGDQVLLAKALREYGWTSTRAKVGESRTTLWIPPHRVD